VERRGSDQLSMAARRRGWGLCRIREAPQRANSGPSHGTGLRHRAKHNISFFAKTATHYGSLVRGWRFVLRITRQFVRMSCLPVAKYQGPRRPRPRRTPPVDMNDARVFDKSERDTMCGLRRVETGRLSCRLQSFQSVPYLISKLKTAISPTLTSQAFANPKHRGGGSNAAADQRLRALTHLATNN